MSKTFNRATGWIVRRPRLSLFLVLVVTGCATMGYVNPGWIKGWLESVFSAPDVDTDPEPELADAGPSAEYRSVQGYDLEGESIILVQSDSFFTPEGARCLRAVVDHLQQADHVAAVRWMDQIPPMNVFGLSESLLPRDGASQARFDAARQKALDHPFIVGQMMSADARSLLISVWFDRVYLESDRQCIEGLRELAEEAAAKFPEVEMKFQVTGRLPIWLTAIQSHESNQLLFQIIGYSMIAVMSVILFRGVSSVFVVALAPILGVFWTLGFIRYFNFQDNPFNDVVLPVLVSLVGFTDGVHLMVQIRRNRVAGLSPGDAAAQGIHQVGLACFLTSLTTAIGFGSLWLAHHEFVREFGACCVIGVICSFAAVVTTIPLACSTWLGKRVHVGYEKSLIDRNLSKIGSIIDFVLKRQRTVAWIGLLTTFTLLSVSMTLKPDEKQSNILPVSSEAAVALAEMDRVMGGLEQSEVRVGWQKKIDPEGPQVMEVIGQIDQLLEKEPLIGHPVSIRKIIQALPGDGDISGRISMADLLPVRLKRTFYSPEEQFASVSFRVQDLGIAAYGPVFERLEAGLANIQAEHPGFEIALEGMAVSRWRNLYQIVVDLATSLGMASIIIFIVLMFVYRSLRLGLISIIPNIFPLTVAGTWLVLTGQKLEIVTVCAFTVCLGIAVDDTIHFLTRYLEEHRDGDRQETVIRRSFIGVGTALIITTIVLVSGFATVLFSDSRDHQTFAAMGAITIASALFGDIVFLPALLARFGKKDEPALESGSEESESPGSVDPGGELSS